MYFHYFLLLLPASCQILWQGYCWDCPSLTPRPSLHCQLLSAPGARRFKPIQNQCCSWISGSDSLEGVTKGDKWFLSCLAGNTLQCWACSRGPPKQRSSQMSPLSFSLRCPQPRPQGSPFSCSGQMGGRADLSIINQKAF